MVNSLFQRINLAQLTFPFQPNSYQFIKRTLAVKYHTHCNTVSTYTYYVYHYLVKTALGRNREVTSGMLQNKTYENYIS